MTAHLATSGAEGERETRRAGQRFLVPCPAAPFTAAVALVAGLLIASASRAATPPSPRDRPECRQFDSWLGDRDVFTSDGKLAGTNRIGPILGGCALLENWKGSGGLRDGRMVLEGGPSSRQSAGTRNRITWTPQPDGQAKQHWQSSNDGGRTWSDAFVGTYRRRK